MCCLKLNKFTYILKLKISQFNFKKSILSLYFGREGILNLPDPDWITVFLCADFFIYTSFKRSKRIGKKIQPDQEWSINSLSFHPWDTQRSSISFSFKKNKYKNLILVQCFSFMFIFWVTFKFVEFGWTANSGSFTRIRVFSSWRTEVDYGD